MSSLLRARGVSLLLTVVVGGAALLGSVAPTTGAVEPPCPHERCFVEHVGASQQTTVSGLPFCGHNAACPGIDSSHLAHGGLLTGIPVSAASWRSPPDGSLVAAQVTVAPVHDLLLTGGIERPPRLRV